MLSLREVINRNHGDTPTRDVACANDIEREHRILVEPKVNLSVRDTYTPIPALAAITDSAARKAQACRMMGLSPATVEQFGLYFAFMIAKAERDDPMAALTTKIHAIGERAVERANQAFAELDRQFEAI